MTPLPCARAAAQSAAKAASGIVPIGNSRTSKPVAGRHRRRQSGTCAARGAWRGEGVSAIMPRAPPCAAPQVRRRRRCGADAKSRGAARHRAVRRSRRRPRVLAQQKSAHVGVDDISLVQQIEQFAGDRVGRFGKVGEPVDGFGKFGGAARAVAHLAGDETRIDGARAYDARQGRRQRAGAGPLRIGHVEHHQIGGTAEQFCRRGKAADKGDVLGAFEQIARRDRRWYAPAYRRRRPVARTRRAPRRPRRRRRHRRARRRRDRPRRSCALSASRPSKSSTPAP